MKRSDFKSTDEYIATFPPEVQKQLETIRVTIKKAAPEAEEGISYQIPTFKQNGKFVGYFAGFKSHLSFYPIPRDDKQLMKEMVPYVAGKGTLRFPLDKPLPVALITNVVKYWVNLREAKK